MRKITSECECDCGDCQEHPGADYCREIPETLVRDEDGKDLWYCAGCAKDIIAADVGAAIVRQGELF